MYENEEKRLIDAKAVFEKKEVDKSELLDAYKKLIGDYEDLLNENRFLTKIGDRLQKKLTSINEDLLGQQTMLQNAQDFILKQNYDLKAAKEGLEAIVAARTRELKIAYDDLVVSNRELDTFVYRASHDLQGPIARLLGLCNLAMIDVKEEKTLEYIQLLQTTSEQMEIILMRLLSVNKLKKSEPEYSEIDLHHIMIDCNKAMSQNTGYDTISIDIHYPQVILYTDKTIFQLLIQNIFEYAIRNTVLMDRKSFISLNIKEQEKNLQIYLSYNGDIIPQKIKEEIFNMFHRTSNNPEHTGMELYTANLATQKLKGSIELISSSIEETLFSIFLPNMAL